MAESKKTAKADEAKTTKTAPKKAAPKKPAAKKAAPKKAAAKKAAPKKTAAKKADAKPKAAKAKAPAKAKPAAKKAAEPKTDKAAEAARAAKEAEAAKKAEAAEAAKAAEAAETDKAAQAGEGGNDSGPETTDAPDPLGKGGIMDTVKTGLKVLGGELKWTVSDMVRGYETKQMRRRLEAEYASLGRLVYANMAQGGGVLPNRDGEAGIVISQIEFLEKEIAFMEEERDNARAMDVERRKRDLGADE